MARKSILVAIFCLILFSLGAGYDLKKSASVFRLVNKQIEPLSVTPRFSTAEACTVRHDNGAYWIIQHWVTGAELYKSYQDPSKSCPSPYPFTVNEVDMVLYFDVKCTLFVSVDVETAELSVPTCPRPGNLINISSEYTYIIPGQGLFQIIVPLDSPVVVNQPYFVGFYISNYLDSLTGAAVVTDNLPAECAGYNIWDTAIGYIDVGNNSYFNFPGRMLLYSNGTAGGNGIEPVPAVTLLKPAANEIVAGPATLWASETAGSGIIDYVRFDTRSSMGPWAEIGRDTSGSRAMRNGVDSSGTGSGYTLGWDYSVLTEGAHWLKATVLDTLGRAAADSHQVAIDPTPPDLIMVTMHPIDTICLPYKLEVTTSDENINLVKFEKKAASGDYGIPVTPLDQSHYGDSNGYALDGNHAATGEFGDYYCGPVAGAIAVQYWFDKGFIYGMREGTKYLSVDTVVERLAASMQTRANKGTYDDLFFGGLAQYIVTHGNELVLNLYRRPDYAQFRALMQERELLTILAISGTPGYYLVAAGVSGLQDAEGRYSISVCDPRTGTISAAYMRNDLNGAQVHFNDSWHDLDNILTLAGYSLTVARDLVGVDTDPADGWSFNWTASNMVQDSLYFVTVTASDATGRTGLSTSLIKYDCLSYMKADYNGDGSVNAGDILYLVSFIYKKGPSPAGGAARADADCNGDIDISDVIYAIRFLYGQGPEPCR